MIGYLDVPAPDDAPTRTRLHLCLWVSGVPSTAASLDGAIMVVRESSDGIPIESLPQRARFLPVRELPPGEVRRQP